MKEQNPPFIIGVLANFSGQPDTPLPKVRERRFVTVTKQSFAQFLRNRKPRVALRLPATTQGLQSSRFDVAFECLEDFGAEYLEKNILLQDMAGVEEANLIAKQAVLNAEHQALHATWRGLWYLVASLAENPNISVKVLDVSQMELRRDLERAAEFDQSSLFKKVYEEACGTFGGEAFGCLVGDYYFTSRPEDIKLIEEISRVAAAANAPFLCGLAPSFLYLDEWHNLNPGFSPCWFKTATINIHWRSFCQSGDATHVFPLLPRFALADDSLNGERFNRLWLNPAFLIGSAIGKVFREPDLLKSGQYLFPEWNAADSGEVAEQSGGKFPPGEVEVEWDCPEELRRQIAELGVNAHTRSQIPVSDYLKGLTCASQLSRWSLAASLVWGNMFNSIRRYIRSHSKSSLVDEVAGSVTSWLEQNLIGDGENGFALPFGRVLFKLSPAHGATLKVVLKSSAPKDKQESVIPHLLFSEQHPPLDTATSLRVVILADWTGKDIVELLPPLKNRNPMTIDKDNFDNVFAGFTRHARISFRVPSATPGKDWFKGEVRLSEFDNFAPEAVGQQFSDLRQLLEDRRELVTLAHYVDIHRGFSQSLGRIASRPKGLEGLAWRIEGLLNALTDADTPIESDWIEMTPDNLCSRTWVLDESLYSRFMQALAVYARWVEERPDLAASSGSEGLRRVLAEIDQTISAQLQPMYHGTQFRELEGRWRAVRWIVEQLAPVADVTLNLFQINWTLEIKSVWNRPAKPPHLQLIESFDEMVARNWPEERTLTAFIMDYPLQPRGWKLRALRRAMKLATSRGAIVVCALDPAVIIGSATEQQEFHSLLNSQDANNLVLVAGDFIVRTGYVAKGEHPAIFEFGRGYDSPMDPDLRANAVYLVCGILALVKDELLRSGGRLSREILAKVTDELGLTCDSLGHAILITSPRAVDGVGGH